MSKKKKFLCMIIAVIVLVIGGLWFYNKTMYYTVEISDVESINKLVYQQANGDVYEITDKDIIKEFVDSIDGMEFKRDESLENASWSSSIIYFYNEDNKCTYSIQPSGNNAIIHGDEPYRYVSDKEYKLDILAEAGTFVENIHEQK